MEALSDVRSLPDFLFGVLLSPACSKKTLLTLTAAFFGNVLDTIGRAPTLT